MNAKKLGLILLTCSFILLVSGGFASFITGLKKDREETYFRMNDVNNTFEEFSANTSVFEATREELYEKVLENLYFESMYQEDKKVKEKLSNYEHLVDELKNNTYELNHLCDKMYYPDRATNQKCQNYKVIYEQVMNYFVSDIAVYNQNVSKYNKYQESLGSLLRIREYSTEKDYIDYNQDNQYDGKDS